MRKVAFIFGLLWIAGLGSGCSKSGGGGGANPPKGTVRNGVDVNLATSTLNGYRTKGYSTLPKAAALSWNDTLSDAAFNFAKDIASQGDGGNNNVYVTAQGNSILDYPGHLHFNRSFIAASVFLQFPDTSSVKRIIDFGFSQYPTLSFAQEFMDPQLKQFGMGEYNSRWYIIATN